MFLLTSGSLSSTFAAMKQAATVLIVAALASFLIGDGKQVCADEPREMTDGKICITFDDLPVVRVHERAERLKITDQILSALDEYKVKAAGFVIGDNIEGDYDILSSWLEAGHVLGSHTYSHPDINEVPIGLYIRDIEKGQEAIEEVLHEAGQDRRYFRYPYLHYGLTYDAKKAVTDYLEKEGYWVAHVSIDTDDFAFNLQFEKIYQSADSIELLQLGIEYIDHILERIQEAEELSKELMGRQIKHILLLHANRINGYFLRDLLGEIADQGYEFISLGDALSDPVYRVQESYTGPKGISHLERLMYTDPDLLPAREP